MQNLIKYIILKSSISEKHLEIFKKLIIENFCVSSIIFFLIYQNNTNTNTNNDNNNNNDIFLCI